MLPLRSVGRSNFVWVCVNLTTLIKKRRILMRTVVLYIYIYITLKISTGIRMYEKQDENSMMSWSKNLYYYYFNTIIIAIIKIC